MVEVEHDDRVGGSVGEGHGRLCGRTGTIVPLVTPERFWSIQSTIAGSMSGRVDDR